MRHATATVISDFLRRNPADQWLRIFVSDEYITVGIDSQLITLLPPIPVMIEMRHRSDVWTAFGVVIDGGLLLEPSQPEKSKDGMFRQTLNFWSNSSFGGELLYELRPTQGGLWDVRAMQVVWVF